MRTFGDRCQRLKGHLKSLDKVDRAAVDAASAVVPQRAEPSLQAEIHRRIETESGHANIIDSIAGPVDSPPQHVSEGRIRSALIAVATAAHSTSRRYFSGRYPGAGCGARRESTLPRRRIVYSTIT